MKKLIIQIPCYNEEATLAKTLNDLPRQLDGVDRIEWLIIDDGSRDQTVQVAQAQGADHIVRLPRNQGLAKAFMAGLEACLKLGADLIVNTDADNQYDARDITKLLEPLLQGQADIVIGARPIAQIEDFSPLKKMLQRLGSWVVRQASSTDIPDAPSGFRAMSREAAAQLNVFSDYTYTLETIIQAGQKNMVLMSVPVHTNPVLRPSRLLKSVPSYISQAILTIVRIFMTYQPFRFFGVPGIITCVLGFLVGLRFLYFYVTGHGQGHVQSLILSALLIGIGFFLMIVALVADLIGVNRKLLEKIDTRLNRLEQNKDG